MLGYRTMDLAHILNDDVRASSTSVAAPASTSSCASSAVVLTSLANLRATSQHPVGTSRDTFVNASAAMNSSSSPSAEWFPLGPRRLSNDPRARDAQQGFLFADALAANSTDAGAGVAIVGSTGALKRRRVFDDDFEKRFRPSFQLGAMRPTMSFAALTTASVSPSSTSSRGSSPLHSSSTRTPSPTAPRQGSAPSKNMSPASAPRAAVNTSSSSSSSAPTTQSREKLVRIGRWTQEEEEYAMELVRQFSAGTLKLKAGTPLRSHLAAKLFCSPMRISTKLTSEWLAGQRIPRQIGRKRFFPTLLSDTKRKQTLATLEELELAFLKVEDIEYLKDKGRDDASEGSSEDDDNASGDDDSDADAAGGSSSTDSSPSKSSASAPQRVGSWSEEEHEFAIAMIEAFNYGLLDIPQGTTLRSYLSKQLCCNPMRITKKLATGSIGNRSIPKRLGSATFCRRLDVSLAEKETCARHLRVLQVACFPSMQEEFRESTQ